MISKVYGDIGSSILGFLSLEKAAGCRGEARGGEGLESRRECHSYVSQR